jgi:hypothetical protein
MKVDVARDRVKMGALITLVLEQRIFSNAWHFSRVLFQSEIIFLHECSLVKFKIFVHHFPHNFRNLKLYDNLKRTYKL